MRVNNRKERERVNDRKERERGGRGVDEADGNFVKESG